MVPARSDKVSRVSPYSGSCRCLKISRTGLSPSLAGFPKTILLSADSLMQSEPPDARTRVWALPVSLAATPGIDCFLSLPPAT